MPLVEARRREADMMKYVFLTVLAILGFLCFTGPDGMIGPRRRH